MKRERKDMFYLFQRKFFFSEKAHMHASEQSGTARNRSLGLDQQAAAAKTSQETPNVTL